MPATPSRIGFIQQEFRRAVAETSAIKTRYGNAARKTEDPLPTYFDNADDAQVMATARQALLGVERRRFRPTLATAAEALELNYIGSVPKVHYVDAERSANLSALVAEIVIDLGRDNATLMLWG